MLNFNKQIVNKVNKLLVFLLQMNSTKPYLRKKAILLMFKVFLCFPDALRPSFPRLKEKLEDPDPGECFDRSVVDLRLFLQMSFSPPGVQAAAVNVICELARKNPKNYLSLAPLFFKLMSSSSNNWVLIKIIKLVSRLLLHFKQNAGMLVLFYE